MSLEHKDIRFGTVDDAGITDLLSSAVGPNVDRLEEVLRSYREDPTITLLIATVDHEPAGMVGYRTTDTEVILLHLATAPDRRRTGVGSRLVNALCAERPHLPIVAETDTDGVNFYAANNFTVTPLGETYPGRERFRVSLPARVIAAALGTGANPDWPRWANETTAIVEADPEWPEQGRRLRGSLEVLLAPWLTAHIEHVGSTAVPGLPAKPVIDLQAAVHDLDDVEMVAAVLGPHGWHYVAPHLDQRPWRRFFVKVADERRIAHLHVMTGDTPRWRQQIAFRDALRANLTTASDYAALKHALAKRHNDDREAYSAAKEEFVNAVLDRGDARPVRCHW